jgi:hypothetical protein
MHNGIISCQLLQHRWMWKYRTLWLVVESMRCSKWYVSKARIFWGIKLNALVWLTLNIHVTRDSWQKTEPNEETEDNWIKKVESSITYYAYASMLAIQTCNRCMFSCSKMPSVSSRVPVLSVIYDTLANPKRSHLCIYHKSFTDILLLV